MKRNSTSVRHHVCFICSVLGHFKQYCHAAMYHFQDLAILLGVDLQQQTNITTNNAQAHQ